MSSSSSSLALIGHLEPQRRTLLSNVLVPAEDGMYSRKDILLGDNGKIENLSTKSTSMTTTATATTDFSSSNTCADGNKEKIREILFLKFVQVLNMTAIPS
jgi:hypothetical protein